MRASEEQDCEGEEGPLHHADATLPSPLDHIP